MRRAGVVAWRRWIDRFGSDLPVLPGSAADLQPTMSKTAMFDRCGGLAGDAGWGACFRFGWGVEGCGWLGLEGGGRLVSAAEEAAEEAGRGWRHRKSRIFFSSTKPRVNF